ncbi:MAG: isopenicillin N synthase family oxygenase [Verrucomicrobia bacterium]|nr:isopenicillin N synthase family oxygenase [Verrucomicrobiota bacterium]
MINFSEEIIVDYMGISQLPIEKSYSVKATKSQFDGRIPVVDMNDFYSVEKKGAFLDTLFEAMTTIGFFAVRNTGVERSVIDNAYRESKTFFKSDLDQKNLCFNKESAGQRGFVPGESAKGNQQKDFKEFYHIGPELSQEKRAEHGIPANIWPETQPAFKETMVQIYNELNRYAEPLLCAITAVLNKVCGTNLHENFLYDMLGEGENTLLRALNYPASELTETIGAYEHTDIDFLTILPYATAKGLQVFINGEWFTVHVDEDCFVINIGDMLENLTNGLFKSALHRVLLEEAGQERFSMVHFVHPSNKVPLDPLQICIEKTGGVQKYAPGTRLEFLFERLLELGIAPGVLETYSKMGHTERQIDYGRASPQVVKLLVDKGLASEKVQQWAALNLKS